jgi:hypothetical protein
MAPASRRGRILSSLAAIVAAALFVVPAGPGPARATEPTVQEPDLVSEPPTLPELVATKEGATKEESGTNRLLLRFNGYVHNEGAGALDIRGHRAAPIVFREGTEIPLTEAEIKEKAEKETLSKKQQKELAEPPMEVEQRLFGPRSAEQETKEAEEKDAPEYPVHEQKPIPGTMIYANADGHHHWHLQHVAKYGLWNAQKTAEVVPSQKVGFCLEDSEPREPIGPKIAVYNDEVRGDFCELYRPNATNLTEGISPGWRDRYLKNLAFQWVEASNVAPGEYWLGEEVNPDKFIKESNPENEVAYASEKTVIPGFVALGQGVKTEAGHALPITLKAKLYSAPPNFPVNPSEVEFELGTGPSHGTLGAINSEGTEGKVTYTPSPGYTGTDSFTFKARDENSEFPHEPVKATVTIAVGKSVPPAVTITSAPSGLTAGTSGTITAATANPNETVTWSASAGTITALPPLGHTATYTAPATPPAGGSATITARPLVELGVAERAIAITPVPPATPALELPSAPGGTNGVADSNTAKAAYLTRPRAMLDGRELVASTVPGLAGKVELRAYSGRRLIGMCKARTPANRRFTCHLKLTSAKLEKKKISIVASLRADGRLVTAVLPAEHIPRLKMSHVGALKASARAAAASSSIFWCAPGTMEETLAGGE